MLLAKNGAAGKEAPILHALGARKLAWVYESLLGSLCTRTRAQAYSAADVHVQAVNMGLKAQRNVLVAAVRSSSYASGFLRNFSV